MAKSWVEITELPSGPERCPERSIQICFRYDEAFIRRLKRIPLSDRAYDSEAKRWYVTPAHLDTVLEWAKVFDEAYHVKGHVTTDLHTGRSFSQGDLFA